MNRVIISGRIVRDPQVRYTQGANPMAIARYTLAVDRRGKRDQNGNQPTADFISCVAFGKSAEFAEKYMQEGRKFLIEGHIQTGSYTNKDGQKVYTTDVIVDSQEFAGSKPDGQKETPAAGPVGDDGFMQIPDGVDSEGLPWN